MVCLFCHHPNTRVTNSRQHASESKVWRRRRCSACHGLFTTYETTAPSSLPLIEAPVPVRFSTAKLMLSIYKELPSEPDSPEVASALAETVTQRILHLDGEAHLTPHYIAVITYETLGGYNKTAALRYGLAHRVIDNL